MTPTRPSINQSFVKLLYNYKQVYLSRIKEYSATTLDELKHLDQKTSKSDNNKRESRRKLDRLFAQQNSQRQNLVPSDRGIETGAKKLAAISNMTQVVSQMIDTQVFFQQRLVSHEETQFENVELGVQKTFEDTIEKTKMMFQEHQLMTELKIDETLQSVTHYDWTLLAVLVFQLLFSVVMNAKDHRKVLIQVKKEKASKAPAKVSSRSQSKLERGMICSAPVGERSLTEHDKRKGSVPYLHTLVVFQPTKKKLQAQSDKSILEEPTYLIMKQLTIMHGGHVDSKSEGGLTMVQVVLPLDPRDLMESFKENLQRGFAEKKTEDEFFTKLLQSAISFRAQVRFSDLLCLQTMSPSSSNSSAECQHENQAEIHSENPLQEETKSEQFGDKELGSDCESFKQRLLEAAQNEQFRRYLTLKNSALIDPPLRKDNIPELSSAGRVNSKRSEPQSLFVISQQRAEASLRGSLKSQTIKTLSQSAYQVEIVENRRSVQIAEVSNDSDLQQSKELESEKAKLRCSEPRIAIKKQVPKKKYLSEQHIRVFPLFDKHSQQSSAYSGSNQASAQKKVQKVDRANQNNVEPRNPPEQADHQEPGDEKELANNERENLVESQKPKEEPQPAIEEVKRQSAEEEEQNQASLNIQSVSSYTISVCLSSEEIGEGSHNMKDDYFEPIYGSPKVNPLLKTKTKTEGNKTKGAAQLRESGQVVPNLEQCACEGVRLLIIDNEIQSYVQVKVYLEGKGYQVAFACSGHEAVDFYRKDLSKICCSNFFRAIVISSRLPDMNGVQASDKLNSVRQDALQWNHDIPAPCVVSILQVDESVQSRTENDVERVVKKPLLPQDLFNVLEKYVQAQPA